MMGAMSASHAPAAPDIVPTTRHAPPAFPC
jgi:hypothetical protein